MEEKCIDKTDLKDKFCKFVLKNLLYILGLALTTFS